MHHVMRERERINWLIYGTYGRDVLIVFDVSFLSQT